MATEANESPLTESEMKTEEAKTEETKGEDSQNTATPTTNNKDDVNKTPDLTPSRRSSRKKQSTFSSDFEYYTPIGRKKELKDDETPASPASGTKGKQGGKNKQQKEDEQEEDEELDEDGQRKPMKRKVAVRKQKGKGGKKGADVEEDQEEEEEDESSKPKAVRGRPKAAAKKKLVKGKPVKGKKLGKKQKEEAEEEESEEEDMEEEEAKVSPKCAKGQKRKKVLVKAKVKGKKAKMEEEEEEGESSDEEESTPISQLKAQIHEQKPEEKKFVTVSSPLAQNLAKKLLQAKAEQSSSPDQSPIAGQKRKLSGSNEEVPEKTFQPQKTFQIEKLAPALAGMVKRLPPTDLGLVKRSPSEIAARSGQQKMVQSNGAVAKLENATVKTEDVKAEDQKSTLSNSENDTSKKLFSTKAQVGKEIKKEDGKKAGKGSKGVEKVKVKKEIKTELKPKEEAKNATGTKLEKKTGVAGTEKQKLKGKLVKTKDGKLIRVSDVKGGGGKILSGDEKKKLTVLDQQKSKTEKSKGGPSSGSSKKKDSQTSEELERRRKIEKIRAKIEAAEVKSNKGVLKKSPDSVKKMLKPEFKKQKVDDLLKRGIVHKVKSHQPFGKKQVVTKTVSKDVAPEANKDKDRLSKKKVGSVKPSEEKGDKKKKQDMERRKSGDAKQGRDRIHSSDSSKGERKKSTDGGQKPDTSSSKSKKSQSAEEDSKKNADEDGPPPLVPASASSKPKHKHHKPEHEAPVDMTMMDLFKPDGLIVHDQQKKEEATQEGKTGAADDQGGVKSEHNQVKGDSQTYIKPEHVHHVLIEHQYSKPSSPVTPKQEGQKHVSAGTSTNRDDDIESVSHKQSVIMDVNLPDQILEESEEPIVEESGEDFQETWPENLEELQQMVSKKDIGDRPSILESLDTELKESGTEFLIVGQVEVGRSPVAAAKQKESSSTLLATTPSASSKSGKKTDENEVKKGKENEKDSGMRKSSTDSRKSSTEKRKDSTDKKKEQGEKKTSSSDKRKIKKKKKPDGTGDGKEEEGEESEEEHQFEDDENDFDWEPNDPDTLYCICQKPHNNRFMICCDKCEEWYHGTCVGITRVRGKEMEEKEEEYVCPVCSKGDIAKIEKPSTPTSSKAGDMASPATPKLQQKCIGRKCTKTPRQGSIYCSNECIMSHAQESLKAIRDEQMRKKAKEKEKAAIEAKNPSSSSSSKTSSSSSSSSSDTVEVVDRKTGKVLKGSSAPTQKALHRWLEQHPTYEVVQPHRHRSSSSNDKYRDSKSDKDKDRRSTSDKDRRSEKDDKERSRHDSSKDSAKKIDEKRRSSQKSDSSSGSSRSDDKKDGPNQIRINVRTALRDSLTARAQEADDIMLSGNEIKSLAVTIEEELFSLFNDTGHKYRTKYRSLVFNIKDQKNKGLFRKILTGKIKPHKLVQMSTEDLASRELAKWREQESKHQLEMIEKTEKEALKESASSKHVRKKTHKGEVEVEEEDLSILDTCVEEKKDPEPEHQEELDQTPAIDTTDQHRAHLFDLNCKVCTGKIVPGPEEQAAAAAANKLKVAHLQPEEREEEEEDLSVDKEDLAKVEEVVKEALTKMQKTEQEVATMPKIVSPPPPPEMSSPPLSPKSDTPRRESVSSGSSASSGTTKKKVVVRSPDSALQSGLESKSKFTPTGPMLWKGFVSMLDVAKFFTSAYRVSGPTDHITIPDTIHIMGRISPDHMWDYLSKIRQAGSKDLTVVRFVPGSDDEKVAYVHLYSYLNSRSRCGVAGNPNKQIKDFYVVPLASHSKIPRTLLPFDGPGLEENRPHMLIGILVRQRGKHAGDNSDASSTGSGKSSTPTDKSSSKRSAPINRDPRLAKLAAKEGSPKVSPTGSSSSTSSSGEAKPKPVADEYEPEYIPMPIKAKVASAPVAEYIPTPTVKKKEKTEKKEGETPPSDDSSGKDSKDGKGKHHQHHHKEHHHHHHGHSSSHTEDHHHHHHHHHHHQHHKKEEPKEELEDDSEPYSPSKEAEPYSPGQEAAADEPYDPADESLMDDDGIPIITSSVPPASSTIAPAIMGQTAAETAVNIAVAGTAVIAAVTAAAVNNNSVVGVVTETPPVAPVIPTSKEGISRTEELIEKMARSNDPQEISSLMVTALSTATTPQEQQKLLVELTKKVEERKLQLAETARKGAPLIGSIGTRVTDKGKQSVEQVGNALSVVGTTEKLVPVGGEEIAGGKVAVSVTSSVPSANISSAVSSGVSSSVPSTNSDVATTKNQNISTSLSSASSSVPFSANSTSSSVLVSSTAAPSQSVVSSTESTITTSESFPQTSAPVMTTTATPKPAHTVSDTKDSKGIKFSITKSSKAPQALSLQAAEVFTTDTQEPKHKLPLLTEDTSSQQSAGLDPSDSLDTAKPGDIQDPSQSSAGGIPDALKALMSDVMGSNTQYSSMERRRKILMQKEMDKAEKAAKEADEKKTFEEQQAEAQKRLDDEMEARKILDSMKKTEKTGGASVSSSSGGADSAGPEAKSEVSESKPTTAPTIDELLERLKKGGFKFPIQKTESSGSTSTTTALVSSTPATPASSSSHSSQAESSAATASFTSSSASSSSVTAAPISHTAVSSTTSPGSAQDVDLRQLSGSPAVSSSSLPSTGGPNTNASSGSSQETKTVSSYSDYDPHVPTSLQDRDDRAYYQDRDERFFRPQPGLPKHPLDPHAFPPLPGDPRGYPQRPHPVGIPPPSHGPLHPRFPLPPAEPHSSYHPSPRSALPRAPPPKGRAQPPPPGTEFDKPAGVLGITNDFTPSDVDLRNRNRPPLPPDQAAPPLPPQPPPPLPPLPGNRGAYPPPPADMDYRVNDPYGPPPPHHHPDYRSLRGYGRGGGRPYHRH